MRKMVSATRPFPALGSENVVLSCDSMKMPGAGYGVLRLRDIVQMMAARAQKKASYMATRKVSKLAHRESVPASRRPFHRSSGCGFRDPCR